MLLTLTLSVAVPCTATVPATEAPDEGELMDTVGGVVSGGGVLAIAPITALYASTWPQPKYWFQPVIPPRASAFCSRILTSCVAVSEGLADRASAPTPAATGVASD